MQFVGFTSSFFGTMAHNTITTEDTTVCSVDELISDAITMARNNDSITSVTKTTSLKAENSDIQNLYAPHDLTLVAANVYHVYCEGNVHITAYTGVGHIYARGNIVVNGVTLTHLYSGGDIHINLLPGTTVVKTAENEDDYTSSDTLVDPRPYPAFVAGYSYSTGTQCIDLRGFVAPTVCGNIYASDITYFTDADTPPVQCGNVFANNDNTTEVQSDELTANGNILTEVEFDATEFNEDGYFMRLLEIPP